MKLLLTSVFGPFGVDDHYGRRLNVMELFHNQVTREQGLFSLRINHPSFGLYLIAENLEIPTAVLDFPSLDRFIEEVKKGYDYIGISSIVANFSKVKKMVEIIRELSPKSKIIIGGHCTSIPGIERLVDSDYISKGEGVSWFRRMLGEETDKPVRHPALYSTLQRSIMGVPQPATAGVIIPGLGCINACSFCATSHHFDKKYVGYLNTGKELYAALCEIEKKLGCYEFFVMDENFLKNLPRAKELLAEMERDNKYFYMGVFSSAETVAACGVEFMAKLGIDFVWIGIESKQSMFAKTKGVDLKAMIQELRKHGIQVLGSAILFLDHHTKENIQEDIDFVIELETDFVQFMELGPLPGTALYKEYEADGRLLTEIPFEDWHGQDKIWFSHPHFTREETHDYLKDAFRQDYERQGPSLLRLADTSLRGYRTMKSHACPRLHAMQKRLSERCKPLRLLFPAIERFSENNKTRDLVRHLSEQYLMEFGPMNPAEHLLSLCVQFLAWKEKQSNVLKDRMRQPPTCYKTYRMPAEDPLAGFANIFKSRPQEHRLRS
jgi:radical SAM superfamily enzyme YgiQ (UPF0313 family)